METFDQDAEFLFREHILKHAVGEKDLSSTEEEVALLEKNGFKLTQFRDIDTLLYSKLIEKALVLSPEVETIIDLGAGSSLPTLLALKNSGKTKTKMIAVDIDSDAERVGKENAERLGLENNFHFYQSEMKKALGDLEPHPTKTLIVSNPPYIACPEGMRDKAFIPVHGGALGDDYILNILSYAFIPGATIALLWGSLTSPERVIEVIQKKYQMIYTEVARIPFGNYTNTEPLHSYLYELKKQGEIYFEKDQEGQEFQYVFGMILRKK